MAPNLGLATAFSVLAGSTVTNTGFTYIPRFLGVSPGTSITGFPPGKHKFPIDAVADKASQAQADLAAAYDAFGKGALIVTMDSTGKDLGGQTLGPGLYMFSSSAQLTGKLTLDAKGDANAVFLFDIKSTLTTATDSVVELAGRASSSNVFWRVGSSATLGTRTNFSGTIMAMASITLVTGAELTGRALARTGAVTLDGNHIGIPQPWN